MIKAQYQDIISPETAKKIGKVGVLYGGLSNERQVSLWSGEAVYNALIQAGIEAELIDVAENFLHIIVDKPFDWAFPVLHGRGGEDGTLQAILDWLHIPYVGSGVRASAIAMDKVRTKQLWQAAGLPVLPQTILNETIDVDAIIAEVGLPMAVKPALEGSSNGISKVSHRDELLSAYRLASEHNSVIMAERWAEGKEYTGALIGDKPLPLIHIEVNEGIYDFETKYVTGANNYYCPCGLPPEKEAALQNLVKQAADVVGCRDWCRVDLIVDDNDQPWLIEINTIPGMTETSLVPKAAKVAGLDFTQTVLTILNTSWEAQYA
ncbi:MAG: D-alanine--D-alanine ligase [Gammaproteobacteria bacterium]|nr:MAG: D-alanine--D-alanine ligase [Gammaproteobacteria bacterium]